MDSTGYVRLLWESIGEAKEFPCAAIFQGENLSEIRKSTRRFARANTWYAFLWPWNCCSSHLRQRPQHHWGQFCAYCKMYSGHRCKMYSGHQEKATGDQIKSSEATMLCVPSPSWASNEGTSSCSTNFRKSTVGCTTPHGWCYCWRCHCGSIQVLQEAIVPCSAQLLGCRHVKRSATRGQHEPPISEQTS